MTLPSGTRLGSYEILAPLGAGGMGEVYRARDARLGRNVAVKVISQALAADSTALARFEREAQTIASLSHPNVVALFEFGRERRRQADGSDEEISFAVMELLDGETLRDVLNRGPLAPRKAVEYTSAIARGLSAAHGRGIVHRDLKPENVFLTRDGQIKILDFGLARVDVPISQVSGASAATMAPQTMKGMVLGTVGYMAPEQVRGLTVDHRADLFALGAILYETLSGKRAFARQTAPETMTAILNQDPAPLSTLAPALPGALDRIVSICLEKRPEDRFESARDLALALEAVAGSSERTLGHGGSLDAPSPGVASTRPNHRWLRRLALVASFIVVGAIAAFIGWRIAQREVRPASVAQFTIPLPAGHLYSTPRLSPDGQYVAFVLGDGTLQGQLWIRPIGSLSARMLAGNANDYSDIFWSPDSRFVAFWQRKRLMKVAVEGGPSQLVATIRGPAVNGGGDWSGDGTIVFADHDSTISRVPATGGTPTPVVKLDRVAGDLFQSLPVFLPDGQHFLYYARAVDNSNSGVYLASLAGRPRRLLLRSTMTAAYAEPGYLLHAQGGQLMAQPFDLNELAPAGESIPLHLDARGLGSGQLWVSASANGTLVTTVGQNENAALVWVDRSGNVLKRFDATGQYKDLSLSPDGSRLAVNQINAEIQHSDVWTMDLERGTLTRLTNSPADDWLVSWSPNGRTLVFTVDFDLYTVPSDGSRPATLLRRNDALTWATDWSSDGRFLVCQQQSELGGWDIVLVPLDDPQSTKPIVQSESDEHQPRFSPDARWIAYTSDESGRREVYVQSLATGGKIRVSTDGGAYAQWRRDGRELYYTGRDGSLMAVDIDMLQTPPRVGQPHALFRTNHPSRSGAGGDYVPSNDGLRFLVTVPAEDFVPPALIVTLNWPELLKR